MRPLDGLRVVDLSHAISGPTATQMLVQLGAEVLKIEPPGRGDDFRHYIEHAGSPGMSVPFAAINAGKRSLTLDLKTPVGRNILWQLAERADILVENFRPGTLARLGLTDDELLARNKRLILASISGFGQTGPMRDWGAYDHIVQAVSGMAMLNGSAAEGPRKIGLPIVDAFSGYLAVIAILAALRTRDATGTGGRIDVAMLDAALKLLATNVAVHSHTGVAPAGLGNRGYRLVATAEYYETTDGWLALGANQQHQVEGLLRVLGHPELIDDPRFRDHGARVRNYDAVRAWLVHVLQKESAAELEPCLAAAGVPVARLRDIGEAVAEPHVQARGVLEPVDMPGHDRPLAAIGPGFAIDAPEAPPSVPRLGADSDAILAELGFDRPAIAALRAEGVV